MQPAKQCAFLKASFRSMASIVHLRNTFYFSSSSKYERNGSRASGVMLTLHKTPLRSYFDEQQKNEIHLLYLYFVFTSFLFNTCEVSVKIL